MFGRNVRLFRIFGFSVRVNISWAFLAILIALSLARGFFPALYAGWPEATYWWMAAAGIVGVFFSIVIHELSHSIAARAFGMEMKGITLFLFGGIAEMEREPPSPKAEFIMAIAGPAISFVLAILFFLSAAAIEGGGDPSPTSAVIEYLGWLNVVLAVFNLVPAFPLDGGRALRAGLWAMRNDLHWATKWASNIGAVFGLILIFGGILMALTGGFVQGLWWFLIGMFIRAAAISAYQELEARRVMRGVTAGDLMQAVKSVSPDLTIDDLVENNIYEFQQTIFPVCEDGTLIGVVGVRQLRDIPRSERTMRRVRDIMVPVDNSAFIAPEQDAIDAIRALQSRDGDSLIVARDKRPVGVISQNDIMKLLTLKMSLEAA